MIMYFMKVENTFSSSEYYLVLRDNVEIPPIKSSSSYNIHEVLIFKSKNKSAENKLLIYLSVY